LQGVKSIVLLFQKKIMDSQQKIMAADSIFQNSFLDCKAEQLKQILVSK